MAATQLAKPQMRRLLETNIKQALTGAIIFTAFVGLAWRYGVQEPRKKAYADFYKTYNFQEKYKIMIEAGLLQSVKMYEKYDN